MANLSLKHIYKIYENGTRAVDDFNLEIKDDEFIVFVGPSGCGKSTTLRMIAGLEEITAGDFYIDGVLANNLEPKNRDMAMVFQNYALYPHMSVYDNMAFGLKIRHVNKEEIDKRVHEAAKILDIENQLDKKPKNMSGGQRQRVALGRAIVRKPKVFLLDEPLSNLDAKLRSAMRSEITRLHNVLKTTFIYVTHDQVEAMTMGSRIVVMKEGVIKQVDTPMNLYDYPENIFVAGFIGTPQMNFINAKLDYNKEEVLLKTDFKDISCSISDISHIDKINIINKKDIVIGVRPEHILITNKDDINAIECEVSIIENLGNEANIIVETINNKEKLVIKTIRNDSLNIGSHIYIKFDIKKIHLFLKEDEQSLLNRMPKSFTINAKLFNKELTLLNNKILLNDYLFNKINGNKELLLNIPVDALNIGNDFELIVTKKEKINNKWLYEVKLNNEYLYYINDNYIDGDKLNLSIDLSKVSFYDLNGNLILDKLNKDNIIDGELTEIKKKLPCKKNNLVDVDLYNKYLLALSNNDTNLLKELNIKEKVRKVFNYKLLNTEIETSIENIIKIYGLLGKKFYLHHIAYILNADNLKIEERGEIRGVIEEIIDFNISKYYKVKLIDLDKTIIIKDNDNKSNINDSVNILIDKDNIGVIDKDFNVRLI